MTLLDGKQPPVDLILGVPAAGGPLLQLHTAREGWRNIPNLSQQEVYHDHLGHPVGEPRDDERQQDGGQGLGRLPVLGLNSIHFKASRKLSQKTSRNLNFTRRHTPTSHILEILDF